MQPENNRAPVGPEQQFVAPAPNGERIPVLPTPEGGLETGAERVEQVAEASAAMADASFAAAQPIQSVDPAATATAVPNDHPAVAADEDVIEKEWVDKAKQIVTETQGDPHSRADRVNSLQKDYLQKRYGKVLGASE